MNRVMGERFSECGLEGALAVRLSVGRKLDSQVIGRLLGSGFRFEPAAVDVPTLAAKPKGPAIAFSKGLAIGHLDDA